MDDFQAGLAAQWEAQIAAKLAELQHLSGASGDQWTAHDIQALRLHNALERDAANEVPEARAEVISELGDLWTIGEHRVLCGDAADPSSPKALLGSQRALLLATDPPYGVEFGKANHNPRSKDWGAVVGDNRSASALRSWLTGVIKTWLPYTDTAACFYFWSASMSEGHRFYEAIEDAGLHIQGQMVWVKNVFNLGQADYQWKHEPCWYAFREGSRHRWLGGRTQTTTWEIKRLANSSYLHPMQKPVELYETPILNHTYPGEVVADPFLGSGTQLVAAHRTGRVCYGCELDPTYVDVALRRLASLTGTDPTRAGDGARFLADLGG